MASSSNSSAAQSAERNPLVFQQPDLICFSHLRWHFVTQRPQHLLSRAATDRRVFFWEEPIWHVAGELALRPDGGLGMYTDVLREGSSIFVIQPHITWGIDFEAGQRILLQELMQTYSITSYVSWYYTPMARGFSDHLHPKATIYDCMDELSGFLGAPPQLAVREEQLFQAADVVFTGGISLYESKRKQHPNVHAFPSSIDCSHFAQSKSMQHEPADQAPVPHPRAGFYGVVDERFDTALLGDLARLRPKTHFIILGPVVKIDPATLPRADNIHYLGGKSYNELPEYLAGWDIALLLFALNDATRFISPTKTPEYLAAGKPVISTPIRDVVRGYGDEGLVAIAHDAESFADALDSALEPQTSEWHEAVDQKLAQSSWDSTWAAMQQQIDFACRKNEQKSITRKTESTRTSTTAAASPRQTFSDSASSLSTSKSRRRRTEHYDYLVVGAGFAGSVLAERLASQLGKRVLIIDQRDHIAGNAFDFYNEDGILVHKYGPHIFHTNSDAVVAYLSKFTEWRPYEHRVLASVDQQLLPIPINLDTINRLYNLDLDAAGMQAFLDARTIQSTNIRTSEDVVLSRVGRELYDKFFKNYTRKQWGLDPSQLDASVAGRIPVRFDRNDRYFADTFQAMPLKGYTEMFERMLQHPRITIRTGVSYRDVMKSYPDAKVVFTGPVDEYFDFRFGSLPYRSLHFKHETHDQKIFQAAPVINYPNDHDYTRVTEFKYLTGQQHSKTSIVYEYPMDKGDPYYPVPQPESAALYTKYRELAEHTEGVYFCGRLANYRYFNMDQVVAQALSTFRRIADAESVSLSTVPVRVDANAVEAY